MTATLTGLDQILYRLAIVKGTNRLLLAQPAAACDLARARRALEVTNEALTAIIALVREQQARELAR